MHKHGGANLFCYHRFPFYIWYKTRGWDCKLIDTYNFTSLCCRFDFILTDNILGFLAPRTIVGVSISAPWTSVRVYVRLVSGKESCSIQMFDFIKAIAPNSLVNCGKYLLFLMN